MKNHLDWQRNCVKREGIEAWKEQSCLGQTMINGELEYNDLWYQRQQIDPKAKSTRTVIPNWLMVPDDVVMDRDKCGFSWVMFAVWRLKGHE